MQILGNSQRLPTDVIFEAHPDLIGDAVSVHLAQVPGSAAVWTLDVDVHIVQGWFRLGRMVTSSPALGAVPARSVLIASCPGAMGWRVVATCPTNGEIADLVLQSSDSSSGQGVTPLEGSSADVSEVPWLSSFSEALENEAVAATSAGVLRNMTVSIDSTLASGTYYLQLWDLASVPADGTAVTDANSHASPVKVIHTVGVEDLVRYDFSEFGVDMTAGASVNLSSTRFTKTAIVGDYLAIIAAEYR
jgi:hypothetical protein